MSASLPWACSRTSWSRTTSALIGVVLLGALDRRLVLVDERRQLADQPIDHRQQLLPGRRLHLGAGHALAELLQIRQRPFGILLGLLLRGLLFVQNLADQLLPQQFLLRIDLLQRRRRLAAGKRLRRIAAGTQERQLVLELLPRSGSS